MHSDSIRFQNKMLFTREAASTAEEKSVVVGSNQSSVVLSKVLHRSSIHTPSEYEGRFARRSVVSSSPPNLICT